MNKHYKPKLFQEFSLTNSRQSNFLRVYVEERQKPSTRCDKAGKQEQQKKYIVNKLLVVSYQGTIITVTTAILVYQSADNEKLQGENPMADYS